MTVAIVAKTCVKDAMHQVTNINIHSDNTIDLFELLYDIQIKWKTDIL